MDVRAECLVPPFRKNVVEKMMLRVVQEPFTGDQGLYDVLAILFEHFRREVLRRRHAVHGAGKLETEGEDEPQQQNDQQFPPAQLLSP